MGVVLAPEKAPPLPQLDASQPPEQMRRTIEQACAIEAAHSVHLSYRDWELVLQIARLYGWEPRGTQLARNPDWDGGYGSSNGQLVTADDAAALASALRQFLVHAADDPAEVPRLKLDGLSSEQAEAAVEMNGRIDWWLEGEDALMDVRGVIALAAEGAFRIY